VVVLPRTLNAKIPETAPQSINGYIKRPWTKTRDSIVGDHR
jgi:hypothetical protein